MLSNNTMLIDFGADKRPGVLLMTDDACASFYSALGFAERVHGMRGPDVRPVLNRWLGGGAVRFWHLYNDARGLAVAEDKTLPELVRVFAAALVCGKPLPGSDGPEDKRDEDGGTKARLRKPRPTKPSGSGAVNPLEAMLSAGGAA
jgi:hypothetical protein